MLIFVLDYFLRFPTKLPTNNIIATITMVPSFDERQIEFRME